MVMNVCFLSSYLTGIWICTMRSTTSLLSNECREDGRIGSTQRYPLKLYTYPRRTRLEGRAVSMLKFITFCRMYSCRRAMIFRIAILPTRSDHVPHPTSNSNAYSDSDSTSNPRTQLTAILLLVVSRRCLRLVTERASDWTIGA